MDGHLFGSVSCPKQFLEDGSTTEAYKIWFTLDRKPGGWLVSTLSPEVASQVVSPVKRKTAFELWTSIECYCYTNNNTQVQVLKKQMHTTRKGSLKMIEYLSKMKDLADCMSLAGAPLSKDDLISNTLLGLDVEYLPITVVLQLQFDLDW
ncbi:hypothetical protein Sjap_000745 [Stephania japonica]|uniref:Uncharacterized protein n=1 Tax=Stephania japonica TaxID=461633 RepID=A0AAP0PSR1_9MAGN